MTLRPKRSAAVDTTRNAGERAHASNSEAAMEKHKPVASKNKRNKYALAALSQLVGLVVILVAVVLAAQLAFTKEKGSKSYAHVDDDFTAKKAAIDSFLEWFDAAGGTRHAHIGIANFPDMGNGIVAYQAIDEHEQLLFVPKKIIICRDTIFEVIPPSVKTKFAKLRDDDDALLTAFLLLELAKNESSFWSPYLQLLPRLPDVAASPLLYASFEDVHALQDERMITAALQEHQHAKRGLQKFRRLFKTLPNLDRIDLRVYSWARFLISSRAFTIRGQRFLVPFGDVFNGQRHPKTRSFDNGQRFLQYHHFVPDGMAIRADRATGANHQIFEDYGDNSNYVYFLYHGFVMPDTDSSTFDCAVFRFPHLQDAPDNNDDALPLKMQALQHFGVANGPMGCIAHDGTLSLDTQQLAQFYFALATTDASTMTEECGKKANYARCFVPSTSSTNMMTEDEEAEYVGFLVRAIETQLRYSYPTTLDEDLKMLGTGSVPNSQRAAVEFRISRKEILQHALSHLQERQLAVQDNKDTVDMVQTDTEDTMSTTMLQEEDDGDDAQRLTRFQEWLTSQNLPINHVEVRFINPTMGYGTFATKPLERGEIYLSVPVDIVMNVHSASRSKSLQRLLRALREGAGRRHAVDDTLLLVLHLLDEKFGPDRFKSRWLPYLDMLMSVETISTFSPLFFDERTHMRLLESTDLHSHMVKYHERVAQSFESVQQHAGSSSSFPWLTETRFRWAHAILDSRSIWWSGERHLVPLLDMVNCGALGADQAPHRTVLDTHGRHAITKASWHFESGDQVVENYAQPNYIYLLYHGFVLDTGANPHDCAHFSLLTRDRDAIDALPHARKRVLMEMLEALDFMTWTPELCVDPAQESSVVRFASVALVTESPLLSLELQDSDDRQQGERQRTLATLKPEAIAAALNVVKARLKSLEAGLSAPGEADADKAVDIPALMIQKYMTQQQSHMLTLQTTLQTIGQ